MNYLPESEDLEPEDIADLALGEADLDALSEKLETSRENLERLIRTDATQLIRAAASEFEAWLRLKMLLMTPTALNTLDMAMRTRLDEKKAMAALKAAEAVLDRSRFPKTTGIKPYEAAETTGRKIVDLNELVEQAEDDKEAAQIVQRYMGVMREVEALRRGAKEIIDA